MMCKSLCYQTNLLGYRCQCRLTRYRDFQLRQSLDTMYSILLGHKELTSKLAALPIRSDTMRVRNAKEQLEAKLCEVEEAIKIFSRPKVFVKCED